MNKEDLSSSGRQAFGLIEFDDKEQLLYEIRKHPFGLFLIYLTGSFVTGSMLAVAIGAAAISDSFAAQLGIGPIRVGIILIGLLLALLSLIVTALAAWLYTSNVMLVTSEKISQLLYQTVFDRKISQLSIGDVQDVSVKQRGIFAHAFNFGTVVLETSGEQNNYNFTYAPKPYECAKAIVNAHEENLKLYGN